VNVESDPGRGSAFTVFLPSHGRLSQTFPAVEALPRGAGQAILVLVSQPSLAAPDSVAGSHAQHVADQVVVLLAAGEADRES